MKVKDGKSLILASSSPRRLELLSQINIKPDSILPTNIDETPLKKELPKNYSIRIAKEKAIVAYNHKKAQSLKSAIILAADTVSAIGRRIMPKAENNEQVKQCLESFSGRRHKVYSSICAIDEKGKIRTKTSISVVKFKRLEKREIDLYLQSGEGIGKSGGYAIQGLGAIFIDFISGSYSGIMGLPIYETRNMLQSYNFVTIKF